MPENEQISDPIEPPTDKTTAPTGETKPPAAGESADTQNETKIFTQADLDRIAANVRAEEKRKFDGKTAADKAAAQEQQLKETGEFKTLYEQSQSRVKELEGEITGERLKGLRSEVAAEHKLPKAIADLLQGDTREAMVIHAKELAKHVAPTRSPVTEGGEVKPDAKTSLAAEEHRLRASGRYTGL